jgi:membrane-associated protein
VWVISGLLVVAAVLGDAMNYHLGKVIGPRIFRGETNVGFIGRALNRKHLDKAHAFFEKYGGKAVILGRFVPIVRTFVPFVAGAGAMTYSRFLAYNVVGAVLWIGICTAAGYLFGNIEWVKHNFEAVVLAIIVLSVLPIVIEFFLARRKAKLAAAINP